MPHESVDPILKQRKHTSSETMMGGYNLLNIFIGFESTVHRAENK